MGIVCFLLEVVEYYLVMMLSEFILYVCNSVNYFYFGGNEIYYGLVFSVFNVFDVDCGRRLGM